MLESHCYQFQIKLMFPFKSILLLLLPWGIVHKMVVHLHASCCMRAILNRFRHGCLWASWVMGHDSCLKGTRKGREGRAKRFTMAPSPSWNISMRFTSLKSKLKPRSCAWYRTTIVNPASIRSWWCSELSWCYLILDGVITLITDQSASIDPIPKCTKSGPYFQNIKWIFIREKSWI